jgi:hypothetical protein
MLEQVIVDIDTARQKGSMSAVMTMTAQAMRLRAEITQAEAAERTSSLSMRGTDELVDELVAMIGKLPDGVFARVAAAVELRQTGRPRVRLVT